MEVFLQEYGKAIFVILCVVLLIGVANVVGPVIGKAITGIVDTFSTKGQSMIDFSKTIKLS